ncbi:MAG: hypothetical protein NZ578_06475 [Candidatus Binatia bacterium]|nr:hypothetical protein [Candidatus Binatia bacterium]
MLDARTEKTLSRFTQEVRQLLGAELLAVALYGSGAGSDFVTGMSDLNIVLVVKELRFEILQKLQPHMRAWHRRGFALPLLLDQEFLERSRDVFPMELHDIQEQHRLLWGEDVFRTLEIDDRHLRFQAEHEARAKLLRLRALYLECAGKRAPLRLLMLDSLKTFLSLMRALLRLHGEQGLLTYSEILERFERRFDTALPRMRQLLAIRTRQQGWPAEAAADFFRGYLIEVQRLVGIIDHLSASPAHDHSA